MAKRDEHFDEELESLRKHLERKLGEVVERKFDELEKKLLLRLRGGPYCRICQGAEIGGVVDPPFSDAERLFHSTNRGELLPGFERPRNWPDVVSIAEALKKKSGS